MVRRALAKERDDRYPSCVALADAACRALHTTQLSSRRRRKLFSIGRLPKRNGSPGPGEDPLPVVVNPADVPTGPDSDRLRGDAEARIAGEHRDDGDRMSAAYSSTTGRRWRRRTMVFLCGTALLAVIAGYWFFIRPDPLPPPPQPVALPIPEVFNPLNVAVDRAGTVYTIGWSEAEGNQVLKLPAGAAAPIPVPLPIGFGQGLTVDSAGTVYVANFEPGRVLQLAKDAALPVTLPFPGLELAGDVAVDTTGAVYVADLGNDVVLKLVSRSTQPVALPFAELDTLRDIAVDSNGTVYAVNETDDRRQVLKLVDGVTTVLPFPDSVYALSVDEAGTVYASDPPNNRILKLGPNATEPIELAISGLGNPNELAADGDGALYVITGSSMDRTISKVSLDP